MPLFHGQTRWQKAHKILHPGWTVLGFCFFYTLCTFFLGFFVRYVLLRWPISPPWQWILTLALDIGLVLFLTYRFLRGESSTWWRAVGLSGGKRGWTELGLGLVVGAVPMGVMAGILYVGGVLRWTCHPEATAQRLALGASLFLLVALHEELLFRGYPFQKALSLWPKNIVHGVGALCFTAVHLGNGAIQAAPLPLWGLALLNIFLAGLLLGTAWSKTQRLALPIGIHWSWNGVQGSLLGFGVSGEETTLGLLKAQLDGPPWLTGGAIGLEGSVVCTVTLVALLLAFFSWRKNPTPSAYNMRS